MGRVLAVYGAKGGVGTSTVARALAIAFAELEPARVSSVAELDSTPTKPESALPGGDAPTIALRSLGASLIRRSTGEWSFTRRRAVREAVATDASAIAGLLEELRQQCHHTLLDVGHRPHEGSVTALDCADRILVVTQLAVPALRAMQRTLFLLHRLGYHDDKLRVVINRYEPESPISIVEAATVLRHEIDWRLPYDPGLASAPSGSGSSLADAHALLASASGLARQLEGSEA